MDNLETWANILGGLFTAIGVIVALFAIWQESRASRLTLSVDLSVKLWEKFEDEQMRKERSAAASALLDMLNGKEPSDDKKQGLNSVLNFFELFGLMFKRKAIEIPTLKVLISFWCIPYWQAISNKLHPKQKLSYLDASRCETKDKSLWVNAENMVLALGFKKESIDTEELKRFLVSETQL